MQGYNIQMVFCLGENLGNLYISWNVTHIKWLNVLAVQLLAVH